MTTINLKDFYYWYKRDKFIEVPDEVAEEMFADKRYSKSHERRIKRNKAQYSLDVGDGIETAAIDHHDMSPWAVIEMMEQHCQLCRALNSLPEMQGRRIEARYILGMNLREIAEVEGVTIASVKESIDRGLRAMKNFLIKFE